MPIWLLIACQPDDPSRPPPPPPEPDPRWDVVALPVAPADPVLITVAGLPASPTVETADGAPVPIAEDERGWVARDGFAPGAEYAVVALEGLDDPIRVPFAIEPYGTARIEADALVGRAWELVDAQGSSGLGPLVLAQGDAVLRIDAVDGDGLEFVVVVRSPPGEDPGCIALRDRGTYDPGTATLSWAVAEATIEADPIEVRTWDTTGTVAFVPDGTRAWARVRTTVDTRDLGWFVYSDDPLATCQVIATFGAPCAPCPGEEEPATCRTEDAYRLLLAETPPPVEPLPWCGIDRLAPASTTGPPPPAGGGGTSLGCNVDTDVDIAVPPLECGCGTAPPGAPLLVVAAVIARSRRRVSTDS